MCDDRLIFQVGEQSVHIVAERSKAVFLQVFFGDIQIAAGHKNKDQDGDSCAKQRKAPVYLSEHINLCFCGGCRKAFYVSQASMR